MPHYRIKTEGEDKPRWIKATSSAAAIRHCAEGRYSAETMQNVEDAADLVELGVKMETAGEPQQEPDREPEAEAGQERESGQPSGKTNPGRSSKQPAGGQEPVGD